MFCYTMCGSSTELFSKNPCQEAVLYCSIERVKENIGLLILNNKYNCNAKVSTLLTSVVSIMNQDLDI